MRSKAFRSLILAGIAIALGACGLTPSEPGSGAVQRKPGLWEVTTRLNFVRSDPKLSADDLEKSRQPFTTRVCVTPEQAADRHNPIYNGVQGCELQNPTFADGAFRAGISCNRPDMRGSGTVEADFPNGESYSGNFRFAGTSQQLGAVEMNNQISGRWLTADCGEVKPFTRTP